MRDKPNSKEGKIITQLLTQEMRIPDDFCLSYGDHDCNESHPLYQEMTNKGSEWYSEDNEGSSVDDKTSALKYYHYKNKQLYFKKEKDKLIHPLGSNDYLILVWNIEPNNWAKVWVLRMLRDNDWRMVDKYDSNEKEKRYFKESKEEAFSCWGDRDYIPAFLEGSYSQTFLESPSTLKLYEGYIHCSGLVYLAPFTENYIRR